MKWVGPSLNGAYGMTIDTLEIAHEGLRLVRCCKPD
jgi:hypothetical protein